MANRNFISTLVLAVVLSLAGTAHAAECTSMWQAQLSTNPATPKGISGDTNAAYAMFGYRTDPTLHLVVEGPFPQARFFSFETYRNRFLRTGDALLDYQIASSDGSPNPFVSGQYVPGQRYRIDIVPEATADRSRLGPNVMTVPHAVLTQSIMMRIYLPNAPLTTADMPRIWAYDVRNGQERSCPQFVQMPTKIHVPQVFGRLVDRGETLRFKREEIASGQNAAIPGYVYALNKMRPDEVTVVRFRAPIVGAQVRYFSVCVQNFLNIETLACAADTMLRADASGIIHVAISEDAAALQRAQARGFNTIHFRRAPRQAVIGIVYRNILPNFSEVYSGDYMPVGEIYHASQM